MTTYFLYTLFAGPHELIVCQILGNYKLTLESMGFAFVISKLIHIKSKNTLSLSLYFYDKTMDLLLVQKTHFPFLPKDEFTKTESEDS